MLSVMRTYPHNLANRGTSASVANNWYSLLNYQDMNQIYVIKLYMTGIKPAVVEVFPDTENGLRDAEDYAAIMTRNSEYTHIVVAPVRSTLECNAVSE